MNAARKRNKYERNALVKITAAGGEGLELRRSGIPAATLEQLETEQEIFVDWAMRPFVARRAWARAYAPGTAAPPAPPAASLPDRVMTLERELFRRRGLR